MWIQALLAIIPLAMFVYLMMGKIMGARPTLGFADYLALCGLAILAFTTLWSYRYTRAAPKLADADRRPSWPATVRMLWVGLWASCIGIAISLLLLLIEVVRLLILFLKAPQGGVPVMRTELESRSQWVSAIDVVTLLVELCTLIGELAILGLTLARGRLTGATHGSGRSRGENHAPKVGRARRKDPGRRKEWPSVVHTGLARASSGPSDRRTSPRGARSSPATEAIRGISDHMCHSIPVRGRTALPPGECPSDLVEPAKE